MTLGLLRGVRVIDFTQALSGPYGTMMLADLGADVIKIESPGRGDDARHWGPPFIGADAAYFVSVNRNKRSVVLDLKEPDGLAAVRQLLAGADVMVENWRPGTAARLGLDPATLRAGNPGLVICSISGYGQDGNARAGYDQIVQGTSGVMSLTGPAGEPTKWGVPAGDISAGMFAATAIIAALYERHQTGRGRDLDIAMQDSLIAMLTHQATRYLVTGELPPSVHNGHAAIAPYGMFAVSDGHLNVCVGNDAQFQRMCAALDLPELALDGRFRSNPERLTHQEVLLPLISARLLELTAAEATERLERAGVPVGAVHDLAEVLNDPEVIRRRMVLPIEARAREHDPEDFVGDPPTDSSGSWPRPGGAVVNGPWKIDGEASGIYRQPPRLGEHTEEILAELRNAPDPGPTQKRER